MIALRNDLPLIVASSGDAVGFESEWLRRELEGAATHAGYTDWWMASDIAAGVSTYLQRCYGGNVIAADGLDELVRKALCDMGYEEVAFRFPLSK